MATSKTRPVGPKMQEHLLAELREQGIDALVVASERELEDLDSDTGVHLALLEMASISHAEARRCLQVCARMKLPVIGLVPREQVSDLDPAFEFSDFVTLPVSAGELAVRARRILRETLGPEGADLIRMGDLVINPTTYEVTLKGQRVNLRFKEYELLRLLATNPGRVYSREALLSRIWGYDYIGGTRTVDVHIRRLRSKIEDADHSFIETIWNVGYRFRDLRGS